MMTLKWDFHVETRRKGQRVLRPERAEEQALPPGRIPRVARLMALALHFEQLLRSGAVRDYAELAKLGHVTRARISQIMNLLHLAPDIQENLLTLPRTNKGRDQVKLAQLQPVARELSWERQRRLWRAMLTTRNQPQQSSENSETDVTDAVDD